MKTAQKMFPAGSFLVLIAATLALMLLMAGGPASAEETFSLTGTLAIPGGFASADISFVDPVAGLWMMADRTNKSLDILTLDLGNTTVQQIKPAGADAFQGSVVHGSIVNGVCVNAADNEVSGPNGVVTVNHREAWVTDAPPGTAHTCPGTGFTPSGDSTIKVIDLRTGLVTDVLHNGGNHRADEVAFDPRDQVFIVANPADEPTPFLTLYSTRPGHELLKKIFLDGNNGRPLVTPDNGIEQPAWSPQTGLIYVALPVVGDGPDGGILVIDPRGDADDIRVVRTFPVKNCTPQGVALGPDFEAFLGCNAPGRTVIIDIRNGHEILSIPALAGGCDEVWFNPGDDHFLGACNQGNTGTPVNSNVLGAIDADLPGIGPRFDSNVATKPGGTGGNIHSLAADEFTNTVYVALPAAGATNNGICAAAKSSLGCIGVFTPSNPDDPSEAIQERREDRDRDDRDRDRR